MKFPGSKLLHQWDLSVRQLSLDDLLKSCRQAGLTGLAEIKLPQGVGLIFYYLGAEVNALYREGAVGLNGPVALDQLRAKVGGESGFISVYELPLDMAHLLRGIANRQRLKEKVGDRSDLVELLYHLEKAEHTGTLEIETRAGAAMVLLVRGRASNIYWESREGLTLEKGEARQKLEDALDKGDGTTLFLSQFSRDVWKSRHEVGETATRSRLNRREERAAPTDQIAAEEAALRKRVLDELSGQVPALLQAFIFDLMTGAVFTRTGRGAADIRVASFAEQVPGLSLYLRNLLRVDEAEEPLESLELVTGSLSILVGVVSEAEEAIAVLADRSQPTSLIRPALTRAVQAYSAQLHPSRTKVVV
ncbi:MAG TPA: hypothetical protein VN461_11080 [Vicinamibacteria bacterium]|jgi:hypothetical protein|nr:hypothetical protein [Vicinamibacteria bacterium]